MGNAAAGYSISGCAVLNRDRTPLPGRRSADRWGSWRKYRDVDHSRIDRVATFPRLRKATTPMKKSDLPPWLQHLGQGAAFRFGQLTAAARMTPGFLICGAQRCGTTSMYRALSQHPAILKAVLHKGIHYFDTGYQNGPLWYQAHFPLRAHATLVARRQHVNPLTFESSPYYVFHPLAASRIARD